MDYYAIVTRYRDGSPNETVCAFPHDAACVRVYADGDGISWDTARGKMALQAPPAVIRAIIRAIRKANPAVVIDDDIYRHAQRRRKVAGK